MSEHIHNCQICGQGELANSYYDWTCPTCGQLYQYEEAEAISLTEKQLEALRKLWREDPQSTREQ